jgi:hypothetical protein
MPPLVLATGLGGYTNFIRFLLKAGADPNIPDDVRLFTSTSFGDSCIQYSTIFEYSFWFLLFNYFLSVYDSLRLRMAIEN